MNHGEGVETGSITVLWKVRSLGAFLEAPVAADAVKSSYSASFDNDRWKLSLQRSHAYPDSVGMYLNATAQASERIAGSNDCVRPGMFKWSISDSLYVCCTISSPPYLPRPPLPPPSPPPPMVSDELGRSYHRFFDSSSSGDVRFVFDKDVGTVREVLANKDFLSSRSNYFRTMFSGGFSESSDASILSTRPTRRRKVDTPPSLRGWTNDDDSLEWLPEERIDQHTPEETGELVDAHEADEAIGKEKEGKLEVNIADAGYITYRAMIYFLYTERVAFTPPASDFAVEVLSTTNTATSSMVDDDPLSTVNDQTNHLSRRAYLLARTPKHNYPVEAASPHAVYRLADKLDIPELKKRAKAAIVTGFNKDNILYELISTFSYHFDEIQQAALKFTWDNWARFSLAGLSNVASLPLM
ncbi:hypothetical protein JCM11641_008312 [Rhodosporidiobolus odoratus]